MSDLPLSGLKICVLPKNKEDKYTISVNDVNSIEDIKNSVTSRFTWWQAITQLITKIYYLGTLAFFQYLNYSN